ncbi:MAG: hypothetical protein KBD53_09420 [Candidatus Omnitrophica bacterium]|nr:hypothetical protein [Candidatus Omnitrophota bacterium]
MLKSITIKNLVVTSLIFFASGAWAAEDQGDRIKEMGFISIKDVDNDEKPIKDIKAQPLPKRVPTAKIVNITPKKSNSRSKTVKKQTPKENLNVQENTRRVENYVESYEPIFVYAEGDVLNAAEVDTGDLDLSADNSAVKSSRVEEMNQIESKKNGLVKDSYGYYNEGLVASSFKGEDRHPFIVQTASVKVLKVLDWVEKQGIKLIWLPSSFRQYN